MRPCYHDPVERMMKSVQGVGNCLLWTRATSPKGYGMTRLLGRYMSAHRASYILHHGCDIPAGMCVCHKCDVPACVNPDHLFLGTSKDNHQDSVRKGRRASGPKNVNAKLSHADVAIIRRLYKRGTSGQFNSVRLGKTFGVTASTICRVVKRHTWVN